MIHLPSIHNRSVSGLLGHIIRNIKSTFFRSFDVLSSMKIRRVSKLSEEFSLEYLIHYNIFLTHGKI